MQRLTHRLIAVAGSLLLGSTLATTASGASVRPAPAVTQQLTVGSVTMHRCTLEGTVTAYCGSIKVPLNYNQPTKDGSITVGFGWLPASAETAGFAAPETILPEEGGPGYPSTGSIGDYIDMLGKSLLATHNLLVVDERGTGRSTLINCQRLESVNAVTTTRPLGRAVHACGASLDHRFPRQGGGFVHASDLFTTANSTRDMARVLNALNIKKVDLYGDSYGTYYSQSFLSHFPHRVRQVTLDSAYEARDLDPWYHTTVTTARRAFDTACRRSAACSAAAAPGRSWHRISRLARHLRHHPFGGSAPGLDAKPTQVRVNVTTLVNIINDAGYDYEPYRQLDAAARAYLNHRDKTPLLRLYAQDVGYDYGGSSPASYYSDGQYFAISCSDYPQLFNMHDPPAQRKRQFAANLRHYPAHAFAPFTVREWVRVSPFTEPYHICTSWPRRVHKLDPPVPAGASMDATHVPVLILNGEFDSLTPAAGGEHIHRQIGPDSRHIVTANTVHLVAVDNPHPCGMRLVRRFITAPNTLQSLDASCASRVPTIRTVGSYPVRVAQAQPAHGAAGRRLRQLAAVALAAAGDAAARFDYVDGNRDLGLRGGSIRYHQTNPQSIDAVLRGVRWTTDSRVSGYVKFSANRRAGQGVVTIRQANKAPLRCHVKWHREHASILTAGHQLRAPGP